MKNEEETRVEAEIETEIWTHPTAITPDDITKTTQLVCPKCGGKSYLKDGKCGKCHHHLY